MINEIYQPKSNSYVLIVPVPRLYLNSPKTFDPPIISLLRAVYFEKFVVTVLLEL
ncbi:hypothetical protein ABIA69_002234 [Lysinibacillus parviboronicapiens]|uniref:Uncharacterized protein n=1 Tax=Lysinibacillus parviboronicapiens TaxID=436516 RepID=A0ABV2PJH9_9BACI